MPPLTRAQARELEVALSKAVKAGERRGLERALRAQASSILGREVADVGNFIRGQGLNAALPALHEAAQEVWPQRWKRELAPILGEVAGAATDPAAPLLGLPFDLANPRMADWFDGYTSELANTLSDTSHERARGVIQDALDRGLGVDEAADELMQKLPEINRSRANNIARTELNRASNGASHLQAKESGVVKSKTYITAGDDRVRGEHAAMDGETVPIDHPYSSGEMHPGESSIGCRCSQTYTVNRDALRAGGRGG